MASDRKEVTRRDFASQTATVAAAVVAGGSALGGKAAGAPAVSRGVMGANDRVVLASIGIRGQGNSLKRGFARLPGVEIKTLCDVDENLFASRAADEKLADVATFKPGYERDRTWLGVGPAGQANPGPETQRTRKIQHEDTKARRHKVSFLARVARK